jgi:hypothetical protein
MPVRFASQSFQIHYSLLIPPLDAVCFKNLTEALNKIKTQQNGAIGLCNFNDTFKGQYVIMSAFFAFKDLSGPSGLYF